MRNRLQKLWSEAAGPCPQPEARDVLRRVNAALDAVPPEGSGPAALTGKLRAAVILAAVLAVLTGCALAGAAGWNVLDVFFSGNTEPWQDLADNTARSVEDENFILTASGAMADDSKAFLSVTVEAKNEEARETLMETDHVPGGTVPEAFRFQFQLLPEDRTAGAITHMPCSTAEKWELATETSRTWNMTASFTGEAVSAVRIRMTAMGEDLWLEIPVKRTPSVTVEISADVQTEAGPVTLERITLSPFSLQMDYIYWATNTLPQVSLRMADGSLRDIQELMGGNSCTTTRPRYAGGREAHFDCWYLESLLDLEQVEAVIFEGAAYPVRGE